MTIAESIAGGVAGEVVKKLLGSEKKGAPQPPEKARKSPQKRQSVRSTERDSEDKLAEMLKAMRRGDADDAAKEFRRDLFDELAKLIPEAVRQAKKGKPALLRILTRYSR